MSVVNTISSPTAVTNEVPSKPIPKKTSKTVRLNRSLALSEKMLQNCITKQQFKERFYPRKLEILEKEGLQKSAYEYQKVSLLRQQTGLLEKIFQQLTCFANK